MIGKMEQWIASRRSRGIFTVRIFCSGKNHLVSGDYTFCGLEVGRLLTIPLTLDALEERHERGIMCKRCIHSIVDLSLPN